MEPRTMIQSHTPMQSEPLELLDLQEREGNACQERLKSMVFRIPESLKVDFRVALMKKNLDVQHTLQAFAEEIVAYCNGNHADDAMQSILIRAHILKGDA